MESSPFSLSGFFMAFLLLQTTVLTQAMTLDIQINIQLPDTGGVLVECTAGRLIPPAEMIWRDSKGNIIPQSTTFDSQDRAGVLYLKSSILLKNRAQGPITCSIYNATTNQEKKRSIVLPDVLFKPEYMSLKSSKFSCPLMYLSTMVFLIFLRGILIFCFLKVKLDYFRKLMVKIQKALNSKMRAWCMLIWECLLFVLYIAFIPLYLMSRNRASSLDDAYSLYNYWLWEICIILTVMMTLFTGLILFLLWTLNPSMRSRISLFSFAWMTCLLVGLGYDQMPCLLSMSMDPSTHNSEKNCFESADFQENYDVNLRRCNHQHQESCEKDSSNTLQPLRLDCSINLETRVNKERERRIVNKL